MSARETPGLSALVTGAIFSVGLVFGGMTQPGKVVGFFDFSRGLDSWDPSLAFVMGGGMLVYMPVFRWVRKRERPLRGTTLHLPTASRIDPRLVGGAALFGVGWGLAGFCPGPAITALGSLSGDALLLVVSMFVGMALFRTVDRARAESRRAQRSQQVRPTA